MTPLCEIAAKYGTDKYDPHNYTPVYYDLLAERAGRVRKVLEIGIGDGAKSLRMWTEFFPNAQIIGLDIKKRKLLNEGRVRSFICDQSNERDLRTFAKQHGDFDIIVDDGSHNPMVQAIAVKALLRFLAPGGIYFIEDIKAVVHCKALMRQVSNRFYCEQYESGKQRPDGRHEYMLIIRRR